METIRTFQDDFNNVAMIQKYMILPYHDAKEKQEAFRLVCMDKDNDNFIYFVSVYETVQNAMEILNTFSCGTFKEINS